MFGLQVWHFLFFIILWVLGILGIALGIYTVFNFRIQTYIYIYIYIYIIFFFFVFVMILGIYIFSVILFYFLVLFLISLNLGIWILLPDVCYHWNIPCISPLKYHTLNFVRIWEDLTIFSTMNLEFMTHTSHLDVSPICVQ